MPNTTKKPIKSSSSARKKRTPEEERLHRQQVANRKKWEKRYDRFIKIAKTFLFIFLFCLLLGGTIAGVFVGTQLRDVPKLNVEAIKSYSQPSSLYDKDNQFITYYGGNENVSIAKIDEIPEDLKNAFIAIEDHNFYSHHGIDLKRLIGAILGQLTHTSDYGASTITQQLVKRTMLTSEKTYKRKIQEIYLALQLERKMSKDEILEAYLNNIFMGGSIYGIKNAATNYYGVESLNELTLRQCASLAAVVQSPNIYSPRICYEQGDMKPCNDRTDTVLWTMKNEGFITESEYNQALADDLNVLEAVTQTSGTFYNQAYYDNAYFIDYAMTDIATQMFYAEFPGGVPSDYDIEMQKAKLKNGGYQIYLTLDQNIQKTVQDSLSNFNSYPSVAKGKRPEASAVIIENQTGEIKAIVGGRDKQDTIDGFNRATDSTQAVGSAIKPLSVYAPALELGCYPGTTVMDKAERIEGYGNAEDQGYPPGETTEGPMTMRRALETSHNVAAARFFLEHVTINGGTDFLVKEGFDPTHLSNTTAGLALGATDVTTLEMTGGYATLANGGVYIRPHTYSHVMDTFGNMVLDGGQSESHRVFSEATAWLITDMLESNMVAGLGTNAKLRTVQSCGKTGTHEHKVVSFGGYTHWYSSFLRISTDDYGDFSNSSSFYQSSALWRNYMDKIHEGFDSKQTIQTKTADMLGIKKYYVCSNSGKLVSDICNNDGTVVLEYATEATLPKEYCSEHIWPPVEEENWWENVPEDAIWDPAGNGWWDTAGGWHGVGYWDENGWHDPAWDVDWSQWLDGAEGGEGAASQPAENQNAATPAESPKPESTPVAEDGTQPAVPAPTEGAETTG